MTNEARQIVAWSVAIMSGSDPRVVLANPCHEVTHLFRGGEKSRQTDDTPSGCVIPSQKSLHQSLVANFALVRPKHVAFVQHD